MIFFQLLLIYHLAYQLEKRFLAISLNQNELVNQQEKQRAIFNPKFLILISIKFLFENFTFILLVLVSLIQIREYYLAYSIFAALFCPLKTWSLILAFYLRNKCCNMSLNHFNKLNVNSNSSPVQLQRNPYSFNSR